MNKRSRNDGVLDLLYEVLAEAFSIVPAWTSIPAAIVLWAVIAWFVNRSIPTMHILGHFLGGMVGLTTIAAGIAGWRAQKDHKRFLTAQIDRAWIQQLSWRQFEEQVAAVFQRRGYKVTLLGGSQPDGGVDVRVERDGAVTLVQCKHWKAWKVGVKVIRELFGVMTAQRAQGAVLITSGRCTEEARQFAKGKPITIIEQEGFVQLIREFQQNLRMDAGLPAQPVTPPESSNAQPACPSCGSPMVMRTAHKGSNAGNSFWGCSRYPACRGIRNVQTACV